MKSNIWGFLFLLCCSSSSSSSVLGNESVVVKTYRHVMIPLTWQEAQVHCRLVLQNDLATMTQLDADQILIEAYIAWIGRYDPVTWSGSLIWDSGDGTVGGNETQECFFARYNVRLFLTLDCQRLLFFICQHSPTHDDQSYTLVPQAKTWEEARQYCTETFYSLAAPEDQDKWKPAVLHSDMPVWIGLHREGGRWKWSSGFSDYGNWASDEPKDGGGDCVSISSTTKQMSVQDCGARFPFLCLSENVVLVRENKTWEEALEHCRASGDELLSVQPGQDHQTVMDYVRGADTDKVWTGLRFLAGDWLWMNKATLSYSNLPPCPGRGQQCGALAKEDAGGVEDTDCLLKLNFLCYSSI